VQWWGPGDPPRGQTRTRRLVRRGSVGVVEKHELISLVSVARGELSDAEQELDQALSGIRIALRAEKTAITSAVEDAFANLRRAKSRLIELETRLTSEDD
jgi:hypothetical protein